MKENMLSSHKSRIKRQSKKKNKSCERNLVIINEEELIAQVSRRPIIYDRSLKGYRKTSMRKQCWNEISKAMDSTEEECRKRWRSLRDSFSKHYKQSQKTEEEEGKKHRKWVFYDKMSFLIPHMDGVSYDWDKILDELGDISEDGQSINCEPLVLNPEPTEGIQQNEETIENSTEIVEDVKKSHNESVQQSSVSVQATDLMSISIETPQHQTMHYNNNNNNGTNNKSFSRQPHNYSNRNASTITMPCVEGNTDSSAVLLDSDEKFLLSCASTLRRLTNRQNALARLKIQQILYAIEFDQEINLNVEIVKDNNL